MFHPCGLSLAIKVTYIGQRGDFETLAGPPGDTVSGDDHFWLVDAALNCRLPKRYGSVTIGVRNLFDQSFEYVDTDADSPMYPPERAMYMKVPLAFPSQAGGEAAKKLTASGPRQQGQRRSAPWQGAQALQGHAGGPEPSAHGKPYPAKSFRPVRWRIMIGAYGYVPCHSLFMHRYGHHQLVCPTPVSK